MPRLSTLFTTLAVLSASLVPVLSLNPGAYRICEIRGLGMCLVQEYGNNQEIQFGYQSGDPRQVWIVDPASPQDITLTNTVFGCQVARGKNAAGKAVPICANSPSVVTVTPASEQSDGVYFIDVPGNDLSRMAHDLPNNILNATFVQRNSGSLDTFVHFAFIPTN
ncbi:unnamed protein product [Rhizoctonia solani]|uniref:Ricin B lectin domain-containing protein n=1 Tax=Rhizoctonia solani TaxID=456999 RepID=A0A8H3GN24_9AGAM|nr:unnamed protein product [Rhizoctonia solani]